MQIRGTCADVDVCVCSSLPLHRFRRVCACVSRQARLSSPACQCMLACMMKGTFAWALCNLSFRAFTSREEDGCGGLGPPFASGVRVHATIPLQMCRRVWGVLLKSFTCWGPLADEERKPTFVLIILSSLFGNAWTGRGTGNGLGTLWFVLTHGRNYCSPKTPLQLWGHQFPPPVSLWWQPSVSQRKIFSSHHIFSGVYKDWVPKLTYWYDNPPSIAPHLFQIFPLSWFSPAAPFGTELKYEIIVEIWARAFSSMRRCRHLAVFVCYYSIWGVQVFSKNMVSKF